MDFIYLTMNKDNVSCLRALNQFGIGQEQVQEIDLKQTEEQMKPWYKADWACGDIHTPAVMVIKDGQHHGPYRVGADDTIHTVLERLPEVEV